jgi:hypothetical protein
LSPIVAKNCKEGRLFSSKIGWNLTPFLCFPFDDGVSEIVRIQPSFSPFNHLKEQLRFGRAFQFRFTFSLVDPQDGIV